MHGRFYRTKTKVRREVLNLNVLIFSKRYSQQKVGKVKNSRVWVFFLLERIIKQACLTKRSHKKSYIFSDPATKALTHNPLELQSRCSKLSSSDLHAPVWHKNACLKCIYKKKAFGWRQISSLLYENFVNLIKKFHHQILFHWP